MKKLPVSFLNLIYHVLSITLGLTGFLVPFSAQALIGKSGLDSLSVSGGIALPSYTTSIFQNPAALVQAPHFNVSLQAGTDTAFTAPSYRGGALYGNDFVGLGAGAILTPSASTTSAFFGLAFGIPGVGTSFGIAGNTGISPTGGLNLNAGAIVGSSLPFRLGFTASGLTNGSPEWGVGLAWTMNPWASIVLDATADTGFKLFNIQPGLMVGGPIAALTVSYGTGGGASRQISSGFTAGGSLQIGSFLSWQLYYNQLAPFYTAITFRI